MKYFKCSYCYCGQYLRLDHLTWQSLWLQYGRLRLILMYVRFYYWGLKFILSRRDKLNDNFLLFFWIGSCSSHFYKFDIIDDNFTYKVNLYWSHIWRLPAVTLPHVSLLQFKYIYKEGINSFKTKIVYHVDWISLSFIFFGRNIFIENMSHDTFW